MPQKLQVSYLSLLLDEKEFDLKRRKGYSIKKGALPSVMIILLFADLLN